MAEIKYSKILVPTDGSDCAATAGKHAIYLAKNLNAGVLILNVVDTNLAFHSGMHYSDEVAELEKSAAGITKAMKEMCDEAGVPGKEIVARGSPASEILKVAADEHAGLIVMGTVGMSAVERVLIGSVSEKVSRHADCPVLLVRER